MSTAERNADRHFGQIINYYLDLARDGAHSSTGQPRTEKYLKISRSLADFHIPGSVRQTKFTNLQACDLQDLVDEAAVKSDAAARGLLRLLNDLDAFGVNIGILPTVRTKELSIPTVERRPRLLTDKVLGDVWISLLRNTVGGSLVSRISCLAAVLSLTTLQPIKAVLEVRRNSLLSGGEGWVDQKSGHHVYVPIIARSHVLQALEIGNICHPEQATAWLFPNVKRNSDPALQLSIQIVHDACELVLEEKAKPQDLAFTGLQQMIEGKSPHMRALADRIVNDCRIPPDAVQIAVLEAWSGKLDDLRKSLTASRWR